jgi:RNA recognition motif-containing protein
MFVGNLSSDSRETELRQLFPCCGTVRSMGLPKDVFADKWRRFGFVEMEGHEARAAMAQLIGSMFEDHMLKVNEESRTTDADSEATRRNATRNGDGAR